MSSLKINPCCYFFYARVYSLHVVNCVPIRSLLPFDNVPFLPAMIEIMVEISTYVSMCVFSIVRCQWLIEPYQN